jgi:heavy metal efflux system protein
MVLERLIATMLGRRGAVLTLILLILGAGAYALLHLPIDAFPDVTNVQVEVLADGPGLSAQEIERQITFPMENALRGLPRVEQLRSVTKFGLSVVTIVFAEGVDDYFARQLVFERIQEVSGQVPKGVEISMGPMATAMGEIYQYTLEAPLPEDSTGQVRALTDLRTLQEWVIAPMLKGVPGVSEINSFGGYLKQYQVAVDPGMLLQYDLSLADVNKAIEDNNQNVGGNILERRSEQYVVRGVGLLANEEDIRNIVLASHNGTPVLTRDIASVSVGHAVRQGGAVLNGRSEAVGGIVMMLKGENGRDVVSRIKEKVREINRGTVLPAGVQLVPYYDRSDIVQASTGTVSRALLEGSLLVLIILYLMLRSIRAAAVVLLALPLSLLLTFIVMKLTGLNANLMSLGGLAISIGMIIDATIIQVENVQRHLSVSRNGAKKLQTVLRAVLEVRKPSIFGEIIIATTFLPILSLEGLEGKMFTPLALTVAVALFSSLLLSIFVIPALCAMFLTPGHEEETGVMRRLRHAYERAFAWTMRRKRPVLLAAIGLLVLTLLLLPRLGTEFMPVMDEGAFDMDTQLLPGVSLSQAQNVALLVQQRLKRFPELVTVVSRTGQTGIALEARGVDKTGFTGILRPRSEWTTAPTREALTDSMRKVLADIPGMAFSFSQPIQCRIDELVAGTRSQLIVKLFGENIDVLKQKADEIALVLSRIDGAADLVTERVGGQPYLTVKVQRDKIARYGLNVSDVLQVVETAIGGRTATQLYEENKAFDVTVRFPEQSRNSAQAIEGTLIPTRFGYNVPVSQVAALELADGPVQISRENGQRRIGIELNVRGRDIGRFVAEARAAIRSTVHLPSGYYTEWGGQFENQQRAMRKLLIIGPLAIGLIFGLLFLTFRDLRLAVLVIVNLPFALIGGVLALLAAGLYLSVPASVGFVVLFGVAVLNGLVLVSHIAELRASGEELNNAIRKGAQDRLRPVLMTASIAIFSLLPMLLATGPGSEIQRPLATVVVGGLITSTLLTLLVLPTLYGYTERKGASLIRILGRRLSRQGKEQLEPGDF